MASCGTPGATQGRRDGARALPAGDDRPQSTAADDDVGRPSTSTAPSPASGRAAAPTHAREHTITTRTLVVVVTSAALLTGGLAAAAVATPGSGDTVVTDRHSGPLDGTADGRPAKVAQDGIELKTKEATSVMTFDLTYPPGSYSGWHSHAGIVVVVVKEGTVERRTGCDVDSFTAGQAFTEVGPHHVSNPGDTPAVLSITRIYATDPARSRSTSRRRSAPETAASRRGRAARPGAAGHGREGGGRLGRAHELVVLGTATGGGARRLVLTHFSSRYADVAPLEAQARAHAGGVDVLAVADLDRFAVPGGRAVGQAFGPPAT